MGRWFGVKFVDRDGNPIEISRDRAGEVRQYPEPLDDVPDEVLITRSYLSGSSGRYYHRPDPEDPSRPDCQLANRESASWSTWSSHAVPGNFPACPYCFELPSPEDGEGRVEA